MSDKLRRHHRIIKKILSQPQTSIDNLQYAIYPCEDSMVLYINGSNERKDWIYNKAFIGVFFHFGYLLLAHKIKGRVSQYNSVILVGHSLGAGTASVLYWLLGKRCKEAILLGCPPSYTWISPFFPQRMTSYRVKGDVVTHANIFFPLFRQAVIPFKLDKQSNNPIVNHSPESYLDGIEQIIF